MNPFRSSLVCALAVSAVGCHEDAVTDSPRTPVAGISFVNAVPDTNKLAFRVVDIVSDAGLFGATFRAGTAFPVGIEAGTRRIRVFFDTTDVVLATQVMLDTTYTFTEGEHYSFMLSGFARAGQSSALGAFILSDGVLPTPSAGKFAIRVVNLAPSFAGAAPTLADTTVRSDAFVRRLTAAVGGSPDAANLAYRATSPYVQVDTGRYRIALTQTGTIGPVIVQATLPPGIAGAAPIAGSLAPGSVITAVIVPRSVGGSPAPQGGRPTAKAVELVTRSNDTVTLQSGSISILTNRSPSKPDSTVATTGTGAATGVALLDNVLVTGAAEPEYNGWQVVMQLADSLSCIPTDAGDTTTRCAATNAIATTRFRFRYRITGTPTSPATGTVAYRIYPVSFTAADFTIPNIVFLVDKRP